MHALRRHYRLSFLTCESLEKRLCLSKVVFETHDIAASDFSGANSVITADLDGDGDKDVLATSARDGKIAWFENLDGSATFGTQRLIASGLNYASSVQANDLDGDGDLDVVFQMRSSGFNISRIVWHENTDGIGHFGPQQVIGDGSAFSVSDLDGDRDLDVLIAGVFDSGVEPWLARGTLSWYENIDGSGNFGPSILIGEGTSMLATDVDQDGDIDVFAGSAYGGFGSSDLFFYENVGNGAVFSGKTQIGVGHPVDVLDVDGDGDLDLLSAEYWDSGSAVAWHENNGQSSFDQKHVIVDQHFHLHSISVVDFNYDGTLDVVAAELFASRLVVSQNTDGHGNFDAFEPILIPDVGFELRDSYVDDIDDDGDHDLLIASENSVGWYPYSQESSSYGSRREISHNGLRRANSVVATDIDGDRRPDILTAGYGVVAWYRNTDGRGTFGPITEIANVPSIGEVLAADLDGDTDVDVVHEFQSGNRSTIVWYENADTNGTFSQEKNITSSSWHSIWLDVKDMDGDGDLDVISADVRVTRSRISWYENIDGLGSFGPARIIARDTSTPIQAADVDGDGDVDIVSMLRGNDGWPTDLVWHQNLDGSGDFGDPQLIGHLMLPYSVYAVLAMDVDRDGDVDIVSAFEDGKIVWHENMDGRGHFGSQQILATEPQQARQMLAADLDGDGHMDIIAASSDRMLAWYENIEDIERVGPRNVFNTQIIDPRSLDAMDLDGDGDVDVLSASSGDDRIAWYENRIIGDSNDDGIFDSSDLATAFTSGKFETGREATFDEGDWNQDGYFDSADLVSVFQVGHYVSAVNPLRSGVAAAIDQIFTLDDKDDRTTREPAADPSTEH